jgi:co-chaperonin GroES (HSP10)
VKPEQIGGVIQTGETSLVERAKVIAVGDEVSKIKEGQIVFFTSFGVDSIDIDGERHYFLLESDAFILATKDADN